MGASRLAELDAVAFMIMRQFFSTHGAAACAKGAGSRARNLFVDAVFTRRAAEELLCCFPGVFRPHRENRLTGAAPGTRPAP